MQAIILAAGMGRRLKQLTENNTKCMIKINGVTLIERMLRQIERHGISHVVIVVGYKEQILVNHISSLNIGIPVTYISNPIFDKTNNIYSLSLTKEYLCKEDTLLFESDIIFEDSVIEELLNDPRDTLAIVDKYENWMDGTCVKLNEDDTIESFVSKRKFRFEEKDEYYKTVNIYKFSKEFSQRYYVPFLDAYSKALGNNEYYEQVLKVITMLDEPVIKAKRLTNQLWYEIDDIQDLDIASSIFMPDAEQKVTLLQRRYGGYWRYPKLVDFSYLVNPYFPPQKMMDEIKANFEKLLTQYPSGLRVNSLLASKNFNIPQDNILVGNGAAELIKALMEQMKGRIGIIRPTFDEYPNRYNRRDTLVFEPDGENFSYNAKDVMGYFDDKDIESIIIINPDNPSGNYIIKKELIELVEWAKLKNILIIVDESFVDFAEEKDSGLLQENIITKYEHLIIIKSISKSYGVPGARLGVMASGNKKLIAHIKRKVAIWNINSFAEFYMQIEEKYHEDYLDSLELLKKERSRFAVELNSIHNIRPIPSQANYIMVEILGGMTAKEITKRLLFKHEIFVKDLTFKMGWSNREFIRIAIRNSNDNDMLVAALREELE